jgi:hypothetical protein
MIKNERTQLNFRRMNFSKLVPSVFYVDISDGLKLFGDCLLCIRKKWNKNNGFSRRAISQRTLS